jgi:hypothetical protein
MSDRQTPAQEPAHDVLAAEAFAMPGVDPALHARQIRLPDDPTGIAEPHDVLAAEDFAMPAPASPFGLDFVRRPASAWRIAVGAGLAAALGLLAARRVRDKSH